MRLFTVSILILTALAVVSPAEAQILYADQGQSGFEIGAGYAANSTYSGFSAGISSCSNGKFEGGVSIGFFSSDQVDIRAVNVTLVFLLGHEGRSLPFSISLKGGAQIEHAKAEGWRGFVSDDATAGFLGLLLFKRVELSSERGLVPYTSAVQLATLGSGDTEYTGIFDVGLSMYQRNSNGMIFALTPSVSVDEAFTTFSLMLSVGRLPGRW